MKYAIYITINNSVKDPANLNATRVLTSSIEEGYKILSALSILDTAHYVLGSDKPLSAATLRLAGHTHIGEIEE